MAPWLGTTVKLICWQVVWRFNIVCSHEKVLSFGFKANFALLFDVRLIQISSLLI